MESVEEVARFLLAGNGVDLYLMQPALTPPSQTQYSTPYTQSQHQQSIPTTAIPRETFDLSSIQQFLTSDMFLNTLAGKLNQYPRNNPYPTNNPYQPQQYSARRPFGPCGGCSDPNHGIRRCPRIDEYIRQGRCIRDGAYRICVPDGSLVTPQLAEGRNIVERIDSWHRGQNRQPVVQTNIFEAAPVYQAPISIQPSNEPYTAGYQYTTAAAEQEIRVLDTVEVVAIKRKEEIRGRNGAAGGKIDSKTTAKAIGQPKDTLKHQPPKNVPGQAPKTNHPAISSQLQYWYITPIEDPADVQKVMQRAMEGTVTLTNKELFSISPEVRKHVKEQLAARQIPTGSANAFASAEDDEFNTNSESPIVLTYEQAAATNTRVVANSIEDLCTTWS